MPVNSNFTQIINDTPVTLGDANTLLEKRFRTPGFSKNGAAFLILNVRSLTSAGSVAVSINNTIVGHIDPYPELDSANRKNAGSHWHTQMIAFGGGTLRSGDNEFQIQAVERTVGERAGDSRDNYVIKNVNCFYHQES
jgi:hypothetical protein